MISDQLTSQDSRGVCVQMGIALKPHTLSQISLISKSLNLAGSAIGGMVNTQRVIDFCAEHNIVPRINLIEGKDLDRVYEELSNKNDSVSRLTF